MSGPRTPLLVGGALLLAAGAAVAVAAAFREPPPVDDETAVIRAYERLRDALLRGDDRAFFEMHSAEARRKAYEDFPLVRSWFLAAGPEEKKEFLERFGLQERQFLEGDPEGLLVRLMPGRSGWRDREEMFRVARVHSVRFLPAAGGQEGKPGEAALLLDISRAVDLEPQQRIPDNYLPTVVFVRDPDGWKRRSFFSGE